MSDVSELEQKESPKQRHFEVAKPHDLSPRAKWFREYFFKGMDRTWRNEYYPIKTGAPWGERVWAECDFYIVPESYGFMGVKGKGLFGQSIDLMAIEANVSTDFWNKSLAERRALFFRKAIIDYTPQEIISDYDLLAGGRFNLQLSKCLTEKEYKDFEKRNLKNRTNVFHYHQEGFGNLGATGGHLIADYKLIVEKGFKFVFEKAKAKYDYLNAKEKKGPKGAELRAMMVSAEIPQDLAHKYREECLRLSEKTGSDSRRQELQTMANNLSHVPWEPAQTFWEGLQSVWMTHMLIMAEENYPGPGVSFGRLDQILGSLYQKDVVEDQIISREFAKEIFDTFIFHCNTVYDAQMKVGRQGITSGFGQLMTLSGMGPNGTDLTNELTYMILEVFDEWAPILEPKPNVRLHRGTPDKLLNVVVDMITRSQGAPFILNFDERSMAGLVREGVPEDDVWDYACVGCLENTMSGNDRSGTVNCNTNISKSIELTLWNGKNQPGFSRIMGDGSFKQYPARKQFGPKTGNPEQFSTWDEFYSAWKQQIQYMIKYTTELYDTLEIFRAEYMPTPYLSLLVEGCIENGTDIRAGPPTYGFITVEGVGFATMVDSLLAIKELVYEKKKYSIAQLKEALKDDFQGKKEYKIMQAALSNRAKKYGNNDIMADNLAKEVMEFWSTETFKYKTSTNYKFRPGMLSWNYWAGEDAAFTPATPNGRNASTFLSNAICPTNGADLHGPTSVTNSVGEALGGKSADGDHINFLPNGASHTITFNPSILVDEEHKEKFKGYIRGYIENGGTALQINILDAEMLKDAQKNPDNYTNLLVRVTGYNAYFNAIGKELQDEIIARESHSI